MISMGKKYPLLFAGDPWIVDPSMSEEENVRLWRSMQDHQNKIRTSAQDAVPNINAFLGGMLHDSEILSIEFDGHDLRITVDDIHMHEWFYAIQGLLGLKITPEPVRFPVTLKLNGIKKFQLFKKQDEESLVPVSFDEIAPKVEEYLFDEIASISRRQISIGFIFFSNDGEEILFDVDAKSFQIEESMRETFSSLLGRDNLDLFDVTWKLRNERSKDYFERIARIRLIRSLRPDAPLDMDLSNSYVQGELELKAQEYFRKKKYAEAMDLFRRLVIEASDLQYCEKLGECLVHLKNYREALVYLYAAVGRVEKNFSARLLIAQAWHALEYPGRAAEELDACLKINPKYKKALTFKAQHEEIMQYCEIFQDDEVSNEGN